MWDDFSNNCIFWRAVWSDVTNKLYVAVEIEDDIAGANDHEGGDFYQDDCLELFVDGNHNGGAFSWPENEEAQGWKIRRDNAKNLFGELGEYSGSALKSAVRHGNDGGEEICEVPEIPPDGLFYPVHCHELFFQGFFLVLQESYLLQKRIPLVHLAS